MKPHDGSDPDLEQQFLLMPPGIRQHSSLHCLLAPLYILEHCLLYAAQSVDALSKNSPSVAAMHGVFSLVMQSMSPRRNSLSIDLGSERSEVDSGQPCKHRPRVVARITCLPSFCRALLRSWISLLR